MWVRHNVRLRTWFCYKNGARRISISNTVTLCVLLFHYSLHSRLASRRHQPACLAFRIYLANNIGLLIAPRCCHLSSSFSGFSRRRRHFVGVDCCSSPWKIVFLAGLWSPAVTEQFSWERFSSDETLSLRHCIRDVHLNWRWAIMTIIVGWKVIAFRNRRFVYSSIACLFSSTVASKHHCTNVTTLYQLGIQTVKLCFLLYFSFWLNYFAYRM